MFITAMNSDSKRVTFLKRGLAVLLMSLIFLTSAFSVAALSKTAVISVDDHELKLTTITSDVDEILEKAGVNVGPYDEVISSEKDSVISIEVLRAFEVTLNADKETKTYMFASGTVADVLDKANVELSDNTSVVPDEDTKLTKDMEITVSYFSNVILKDGKQQKKTVKVPQGTVENALKYLKIELSKDDKLSVKLTDNIKDNMVIEITRVEYKDVESKEEVPYETVKETSDELGDGETKTVTKGVKGEKTIVTRQTIVNGKVTKEEVTKEEVTKKPVTEKILVGPSYTEVVYTTETVSADANTAASSAKSSGQSNASGQSGSGIPVSSKNGVLYDSDGNEVSYSNVLHGSGTAYYAPAGSLTATGKEVCVGGVAVNPNIIPYGSKLYIVADDGFVYGYATAIDTGGALMSGEAIVDVFYFTYEECVKFGRRNVSVYVLS